MSGEHLLYSSDAFSGSPSVSGVFSGNRYSPPITDVKMFVQQSIGFSYGKVLEVLVSTKGFPTSFPRITRIVIAKSNNVVLAYFL